MISILFENGDFVALNKPEGIASIPERRPEEDCLLSQLSQTVSGKLYIVHRLDKDVSGVILFAKNSQTHKWLNDQFSGGQVDKRYTAITHGIIKDQSGTIDKPIREFGSGRMGVDDDRGKPSITKYGIEERFDAHTLVNVKTLTGRRHQIRVHLYSIGHPIVGDNRYGNLEIQKRYPRLMLHARTVTFIDSSGREVTIDAPLPESIEEAITNIRSSQ